MKLELKFGEEADKAIYEAEQEITRGDAQPLSFWLVVKRVLITLVVLAIVFLWFWFGSLVNLL